MSDDDHTPLEDETATPVAEPAPSGDTKHSKVKAPRPERPRTRKPWVTVYATEEERLLVAAAADRSNLTVSAYLLQRGLQSQVVVRTDWQEAVARLGHIHAELARVAELATESGTPIDAVRIILHLVRIEEAARGVLMGQQRSFARLIDEVDWSASGLATSASADDLQVATAAPTGATSPADPAPHTAPHTSEPSLESDASSPPGRPPC